MKPIRLVWCVAFCAFALTLPAAELRLGMVGLDTSHAVVFTKLLNDPAASDHVPGGKVTVAVKQFSPDVESSASRVDKYTKELQEKYGVKLAGSVEEMLPQVDAVLIESVDGRPHLAQAKPVILARKPVFIDKPMAGSLKDVLAIFQLAKEHKTPVFSASAYRYYDSLVALSKTNIGVIKRAISYGPMHFEEHHPDLFWYGIHPTEALFTVLGRGCVTVTRTATEDTDVITGIWRDGRVGILCGMRGTPTPHKVTVFGDKGVAEQQGSGTYTPLVREIMKFFQTGVAPVSAEETIEIFTFMEAADLCKSLGRSQVQLADVLAKGRK